MSNFDQKSILDFLLHVLHPDFVINNSSFPKSDVFWNKLVYFASGHLILPAFYIDGKKLINYVPKDLIVYLTELSDLNQKRNIEINNQIKLYQILKKTKISMHLSREQPY